MKGDHWVFRSVHGVFTEVCSTDMMEEERTETIPLMGAEETNGEWLKVSHQWNILHFISVIRKFWSGRPFRAQKLLVPRSFISLILQSGNWNYVIWSSWRHGIPYLLDNAGQIFRRSERVRYPGKGAWKTGHTTVLTLIRKILILFHYRCKQHRWTETAMRWQSP